MTTNTFNTTALDALEDQIEKLRRKKRAMRAGINNLKAHTQERRKWRKAVQTHIERFASLGIIRPAIVALHLNQFAVPRYKALLPWTGREVRQFKYRGKENKPNE